MSIALNDYPKFNHASLVADHELLDGLAATYVESIGGRAPEMERFLFGDVPVRVFDQIFAGRANDSIASLLWLMYLSGYFGGRWLRGEIAHAQPNAPLISFSMPPTEQGFQAMMAIAQGGLDASLASDEAALAYARSSLFDTPSAIEGGEPLRGLTDNFGYNLGYMLEILAAPPSGLHAGAEYQVKSSGLFDCEFATRRLAVLAELAPVQAAVSRGQGSYAALSGELMPLQEDSVPRGRSVWSTGLSVQGFSQKSYDQLLDVSSSFLETVQAAALTMAQASVEGNAAQARRGALANSTMVVWLASYRDGLLNGEGEISLPTFR